MRKNLVAILSIALMLLVFASCTNDNASSLPNEEAGAIAAKIDPVQLMNDALSGKIKGATVTVTEPKAATTLIATVEFSNNTYNGMTISSGRLRYTLTGELNGTRFSATSYRVTTEQELSIIDDTSVTVSIEIPETTTASTRSSITATVTTDTEGNAEIEITKVSISLPSSGAEVTVGGNDVTDVIPSDPEPETPSVSYVTVTLTTAEGESTTASVVQGSTYTFTAPASAPEGKVFLSWSNGNTEYSAGDTLKINADMTFTANFINDTTYARFNGTEYETLTAALDAVKAAGTSPATVELLRDVTDGEGYSFADGSFNVTIDLRGNTYSFFEPSVGSSGTETQGFQIKRDNTVTIKNGTLNIAETTGDEGIFKMVIQNYSNLTLDNVVVDGSNLIDEGLMYTLSNNFGDTVLKNNTKIIAVTDADVAFDVWYWPENSYEEGVTVNIKDTSVIIEGLVEYADRSGEYPDFYELTSLTIPSGYESKIQLTDATENGREWIDNGDGTKSFRMPAEEEPITETIV